MLPKSEKALLRQHIAEAAAAMLAEGGGTARECAKRVVAAHDDLVAGLGRSLALDQITSLSRGALKQWSTMRGAPGEPPLPGLLIDDLPASISVPSEDGDEDGVRFVPLSGPRGATVNELARHIEMQTKNVANDHRRLRATQELYERLLAIGARPEQRISEALAALQTV